MTVSTTAKKKWQARAETALSIAVGMLALWVVLILPVGLTATILVPSDEYNLQVFGIIAAILTIATAAVSVIGYRWAQRRPESETYVLGKKDKKVSPTIGTFRVRARLHRLAAGGLFTLLAAVTVGGFFLVSTPARERVDYHENLPGELSAHLEQLIITEERREAVTNPEVRQLLTAILNRSTYPTWAEIVGSVTLWVILVQVTASLFRYMVRLAAFYDSRADYLQLGGAADAEKLLEIIEPGPATADTWIQEWIRRIGEKQPSA